MALGLKNCPSGSLDGQGFGDAGSWNDVDSNNELYYVIEFDLKETPEPEPTSEPENPV